MISLLTNKWGLGAVAGAMLAGALAVQTARLNVAHKAERAAAQIASQWRANFEAMEATNAANVRAVEKLQAEARRIEGEANTARQHNKRLAAQYDTFRKSITHANDASSLSPVLCHTLNELRRIQQQPGPACRQ